MYHVPKVDQTALSKEDDVTAAGHCVAINLRLDVDNLNGVLLEPGDVAAVQGVRLELEPEEVAAGSARQERTGGGRGEEEGAASRYALLTS